jgi:hypothetical protein
MGKKSWNRHSKVDCISLFISVSIGVRMLGVSGITDSQEAQALSHYISNVDIYSNSWGPIDGYGFVEPGTMTKAALQTGTTTVSIIITSLGEH